MRARPLSVEAADAFVTPPPMTLEERRRRDRERKRLGRFLARGGVVLREAIGGAVGERWARPSRSGSGFDPAICSAWLQNGRLEPLPDAPALFRRRAEA